MCKSILTCCFQYLFKLIVLYLYNVQYTSYIFFSDISNIMAHSVDSNEQKYYWLEWRKATGKHVRSLFEHYVSLLQLAAKENGKSITHRIHLFIQYGVLQHTISKVN